MKKSVKKILTQIGVGALICTVIVPFSTFKASPAGISEAERAAQIQQAEFQKYHSYEWEMVKSKIRYHEEEIKVLEQNRRAELDGELAQLLQVEEDINARKSSYPWWSWDSWNLSNQLSDVRRKISFVRSKISANNDRIKYLKRAIEDLDKEYAILLQNQEASRLY